jgi:hypothetical protein
MLEAFEQPDVQQEINKLDRTIMRELKNAEDLGAINKVAKLAAESMPRYFRMLRKRLLHLDTEIAENLGMILRIINIRSNYVNRVFKTEKLLVLHGAIYALL